MRHPFVDVWEFEAWTRSIANAIRVYAGRIDELPPYAFPAIIRDPSASVPKPTEVAPELLTDWGALIDEVNTAITETFSDAPATMTAYEMPDIIAAHATPSGGGPLTFIEAGTLNGDASGVLMSLDFGGQYITPPAGSTVCSLMVDMTEMSTDISSYPGTVEYSMYANPISLTYTNPTGPYGLWLSTCSINGVSFTTVAQSGRFSITVGGDTVAYFQYTAGPNQTFTGTGKIYIAFK